MRHTERSEVAPATEALDDPEDLWAELVIDEERTRFDSIIKQEMKQISDGTAKGKLDPKDAGPVSDPIDYQYNIRPFYYAHGYSHPADFLSQQVEFMMFPLYLAVALVVKQNLRWGEQYEQSKDGMHFELVRDDGGPVIPPDAKGAELRTLKQLMDDAFSAKTPKFHF